MNASLHRFRVAKSTHPSGNTDRRNPQPAGRNTATQNNSRSNESHYHHKPIKVVCKRCRRLKKKCSRERPACVQCLKAETPCTFDDSTTSSDAASVPESNSRTAWLRERLTDPHSTQDEPDLPQFAEIDSMLQTRSHQNESSASELLVNRSEGDYSVVQDELLREGTFNPVTNAPFQLSQCRCFPHDVSVSYYQCPQHDIGSWDIDPRQQASAPQSQSIARPSDPAARQFVDAYFRHIHRMYPFMDRARILEDLQGVCHGQFSGLQMPIKLYLIMAIGCTTLRRVERVSDDVFAKFRIPYAIILQECLTNVDVESTEKLLLLLLYSLFDPTEISPVVINGILSHHVVSLGLGRKSSVDMPLKLIERRYRLYWSAYCMDRLLAVCTGMPFCINDMNVDIALPSLTHTEIESPAREYYSKTLQVNRHLVALRQLEDEVLSKIHFSSREVGRWTRSERSLIEDELRTKAENWFTQGTLMIPYETDPMPYHITTSWLSHRLQGLMLILNIPSRLHNSLSQQQISNLQECVQRYIQTSFALRKQRQLALNWVTLSSTIGLSSVLLYCVVCSKDGINPIGAEATICAEILDSFPSTWEKARRGSRIFRLLASFGLHTDSLDENLSLQSGTDGFLGVHAMYSEIKLLIIQTLGEPSIWYGVMFAVKELMDNTQQPQSSHISSAISAIDYS